MEKAGVPLNPSGLEPEEMRPAVHRDLVTGKASNKPESLWYWAKKGWTWAPLYKNCLCQEPGMLQGMGERGGEAGGRSHCRNGQEVAIWEQKGKRHRLGCQN